MSHNFRNLTLFFDPMMSPCSCQPVTRPNPLSALRRCATLQVPEQDRVTDAQCSKEAPAVSLSLLPRGTAAGTLPACQKVAWRENLVSLQYSIGGWICGTAQIRSLPAPCLFLSPRLAPFLHPCYYRTRGTIAQPAGAQTFLVSLLMLFLAVDPCNTSN